MRATLRITWLLLSFSVLFHSICSADTNSPNTQSEPKSNMSDKSDSRTSQPPSVATTAPNTTTTAAVVTTTAAATTTTASATTTTTAATAATAAAAAVTTTAAATTTTTTATITTTTAAAATTTISPTTTVQTSSTALGVTTKASSTQTPNPSVTSKVTDAVTLQKQQGQVNEPTTTPQSSVTTDASRTTPQPTTSIPNPVTTIKTPPNTITTTNPRTVVTITTTNPKGSQEDSTGEGTKKMTVTVKSSEETSRTPQSDGNLRTTHGPSAPTKAGLPTLGTLSTKAGTTPQQIDPTTTPTKKATTTPTVARPQIFSYSLNYGREKEEEKELVEVCKRLMANFDDGNCTLSWRHHNGKTLFDSVDVQGKVRTRVAAQYYEEITKKQTDNKTLIAILASCGALLIMIVILAVCASHHRKPYRENQQHLTEELHTVENGYHDNPTLEVMEVQPEMQEKKMAMNGEFNDSWIVPIDNLLKEDIPDEEDTHL